MKKFILLISLIWLGGCEKKISFDLEEAEPKIVIDATIENNLAPVVIITKSLNYFSKIDPRILANSFVHDADVSISNGAKTHKLKEYSYLLKDSSYTLFYYSIDSGSLATAFPGSVNTNYSLKVISQGKEYNATTTIPNITKRVDSIWWKKAPAQDDSSKAIVLVRATDPRGFGDYVRYFTQRNKEPFFPPFNSVFDDLVIDATTYELQVEPGIDRNADRNGEGNFFNRGDTVTLKLCNIDKASYEFWRTMEYSLGSVGNPFATPVKVLSNINNGALGYFGGYACQYHTIIIPR